MLTGARYAGPMRIIVVPFVLAIGLTSPASAQVFSGQASVVDGDTLEMSGERVRLFGIDAPEAVQTCQRGAKTWRCGQDAKRLLAELVGTRTLECAARDRDHYGRVVATCRAGESDLSAVMVREGFAVALPQFTTEYVPLEMRAKGFRLALWGSTFQLPADFRRANPALFAATTPRPAARPNAKAASRQQAAGWSYRNCAQARAAGAAPLYRGQPGYGAHMDGDGDGIACEPYRG